MNEKKEEIAKEEIAKEQTLSEQIFESLSPMMNKFETVLNVAIDKGDTDTAIKIGSLIARIKKDVYTADAQIRVMANSAIGAQMGIEKIMHDKGKQQKEEEAAKKMLESLGPERVGTILEKLGAANRKQPT